MPILWKTLLLRFWRLLGVSSGLLVFLLFVLRFQEIASFVCLGASPWRVFLFSISHLPYLLPLAIPLALVWAVASLGRRLSLDGELTALRMIGLPIRALWPPILASAVALTLLNSVLVLDITPKGRLAARAMVHRLIIENPLLLFDQNSLVSFGGTYFDGQMEGKKLLNGWMVTCHPQTKRLSLAHTAALDLSDGVKGHGVTLFSSVPTEGTAPPSIVVDYAEEMEVPASLPLMHLLHGDLEESHDCFGLSALLGLWNVSPTWVLLELSRRISLALAPLSLAIAIFPLSFPRPRSTALPWNLILVTLCFFVGYLAAKGMLKTSPLFAIGIQGGVHLAAWAFGLTLLYRRDRAPAF